MYPLEKGVLGLKIFPKMLLFIALKNFKKFQSTESFFAAVVWSDRAAEYSWEKGKSYFKKNKSSWKSAPRKMDAGPKNVSWLSPENIPKHNSKQHSPVLPLWSEWTIECSKKTCVENLTRREINHTNKRGIIANVSAKQWQCSPAWLSSNLYENKPHSVEKLYAKKTFIDLSYENQKLCIKFMFACEWLKHFLGKNFGQKWFHQMDWTQFTMKTRSCSGKVNWEKVEKAK